MLFRRPNGRLCRPLLPLAVVACLFLTACQDDSEPAAAPLPTPSTSATSPTATPTPTPSTDATLDAAAEDFLDRMARGMGDSGTAHLEMRVGGRAATRSSGDMRYDGRGSEIRLTSTLPELFAGAAGRMQVVVLRDAAYLSIPGVVPPGKFIRVGKDDPRFAELAGASIRMSPDQSVKAFRAGLVSVDEVGTERVQGERTTRYAVEVDTVRALQAQGSDVVPGMPETLTYQVWLDGQDRMRRMALAIQGTRLRIDISRWGQPVDITAPPRSALVEPPPGF